MFKGPASVHYVKEYDLSNKYDKYDNDKYDKYDNQLNHPNTKKNNWKGATPHCTWPVSGHAWYVWDTAQSPKAGYHPGILGLSIKVIKCNRNQWKMTKKPMI